MANYYISNAFSLQMLDMSKGHEIQTYPLLGPGAVREFYRDGLNPTSAIGHQDTASVVSDLVGIDIPCQRINLKLDAGDTLIVAQLTGGRLPEGATKLPEGFDIRFMVVKVKS